MPLSATEAHLFFQVISQTTRGAQTIITSNRAVVEWGEYLSDVTLAVALLDRFLHHCHVLSLQGDSYPLKNTLDLVAGKQKRTTKPKDDPKSDGA